LCALVRFKQPASNCADSEYPISDKRLRPGEHLRELKIVKVAKAITVIEAHQPYVLGRPAAHTHPLWVLNKLNNWDKHRVLQVGFLEFVIPIGASTVDFQETQMKDGLTARHIVVHYPPGMNVSPAPAPVIVFSKPGPAYGDPVTWRLGTIHEEVNAVMTELEPLLR
jgi:hypothetical protein